MLARAGALLRRADGSPDLVFRFGDFQLDREARLLTRGAEPVPLTAKEYSLLDCLTRRAGRACRPDPKVPLVALATAHPAKFPDAVQRATGIRPELPERLADLYARSERCAVLPNDLGAVQRHVQELVMETV